jgi:two-component system phosphate regulon response regulator PhoB
MARILIVDDETNYRVLLRACLERAGHEVLDLGRGAEVLELARSRQPDAILLDFDLPDGLGTDVCRSLKANAATSSIPVIMVTGRTGEQDRVECFEAGADDLVGKPFSLRELLLRVRILVQRKGIEPRQVIRLGLLTLDIGAHRVQVGGVSTDLTRLELALLRALCEQPARVLSRDELLDGVWGIEAGVDGRVVDSYVSRLRQKLGQAGGYIRTIRGEGYRLDPAS